MFTRRLQYGVLLFLLFLYYAASGEWISWILLLAALGLPWLSLLLSLPAIITFRVSPTGVGVLEQGEEAELWLLGSCRSPMPPFQGRIRVADCLNGKHWRYQPDRGFSTDHCGGFRAAVERAKVYDYLGLFAFRVRRVSDITIVVRPKPMAVTDLTDPQRLEINRWVPKPGGGFSENHEHRLYRPGDNLNQLHWKLSAKVGDLILREPMEAVRGAVLLSVSLRGTPEELDRKFGRLLWVGRFLLEKELNFEIRALTGRGIQSSPVDSEAALLKAMDSLLCTPLAEADASWGDGLEASWQYHIGGGADEA